MSKLHLSPGAEHLPGGLALESRFIHSLQDPSLAHEPLELGVPQNGHPPELGQPTQASEDRQVPRIEQCVHNVPHAPAVAYRRGNLRHL
jgi:hypothetical protein